MTKAKEFFSAAEIAELKLPTMPTTARGVEQRARKCRWSESVQWSRKRQGRGGGYEYHFFLFPYLVRRELRRRRVIEDLIFDQKLLVHAGLAVAQEVLIGWETTLQEGALWVVVEQLDALLDSLYETDAAEDFPC